MRNCFPELILVFSAASLVGCSAVAPNTGAVSAGEPAATQKAPKLLEVQRQRVVTGDSSAVRERLLRKFKGSRFKLDDVTGPALIRVSLQAEPSRYVDCGEVVVPAGGGRPASKFPGAIGSHTYTLPINQRMYGVTRKLQLLAVAELQFKSLSAGQSRVDIDVKYHLKRQQRAVAEGVAPIQTSDELVFSSGESATFPNAPTKCSANGRLEDELLDMAG